MKMKDDTKRTKHTNQVLKGLFFEGSALGDVADLIEEAKHHFDGVMGQMKLIMVECLLSAERELLAGPDYLPEEGWQKWGYQRGSVYVGGEKMPVKKPRLRKLGKESDLSVYKSLRNKNRFSEELMQQAFRGISSRNYRSTLHGLLKEFGISKSTVSRHIVRASAERLKELQERSLSEFNPFAIFIDGYHIGGEVYMIALGIDIEGQKKALGFWQGATENHVICQELLSNLEERGVNLDGEVLWVTDGGKGIIKALKEKHGEDLIHQRCAIHKDRNIQAHLPKKYRKEAHKKFKNAIDCVKYEDANKELKKLEEWLEKINPSAAESLKEGKEELLMVHQLEIPTLLKKTLYSTNPIESMLSQVSHLHTRVKNMRGGRQMARRWVGSNLLEAEKKFRTVKGHLSINEVREKMKALQKKKAKAA